MWCAPGGADHTKGFSHRDAYNWFRVAVLFSISWDNDRTKVAGTWNCNSHHAYTKNGLNLGYAATLFDAALLIVQ
ncbi:hypothetical protein [Prochlorothrix hollandica]|uniref:Uncharacterized protein n=1 Tax=Prochlorothrix hollandica PCC 9006 = CALU 1027 TaxID=317619 RepID=A0A0M2PUU1_PROHO|nr:hypothetical protein [Prochlorothrix hollandica]KKI99879.1 hypothetical protein PROH_08630 [Prochlorothrix hollandica PCC 9006 = CALU 1027]